MNMKDYSSLHQTQIKGKEQCPYRGSTFHSHSPKQWAQLIAQNECQTAHSMQLNGTLNCCLWASLLFSYHSIPQLRGYQQQSKTPMK